MNERKKTRPAVGAAEQAESGNDFAGQDSREDCIMINPPCRVPRVVDLLLCGAENAICLADLVSMTGRDGRTIRQEIHRERRRGTPIVSENSEGVRGYYIAATSEELRRFARSMAHRAGEILAVARAAERTLADFEGQEMVEGFDASS